MWKSHHKYFMLVISLAAFVLFVSGCILLPDESPGDPTAVQTVTNIPTPAGMVIPPTATVEIIGTVETPAGETATPEPVDSATPLPTDTQTPEPTDEPTNTPEPTQTPYIYEIQTGTPAYIKNFAHPDSGCTWVGVAGQIFNQAGQPELNLVALVSGIYNGKIIESIGISGTDAGDNYGPGGFEIIISNTLISTSDSLNIQLFDLNGLPISDAYSFDTYNACDKNLIIINFVSR